MIIALSRSCFYTHGISSLFEQPTMYFSPSECVYFTDKQRLNFELEEGEKLILLIDNSTRDISLLVNALSIKLFNPKAIVISFVDLKRRRTNFENILLNVLSSYISDYRINTDFLMDIISTAQNGEVITIPAEDLMWIYLSDKFKMTKRESLIFTYIICGYNNKEISKILFLSCKTVSLYRTNIYKKLKVKSVSGLGMFLNERLL